MSYRRRPTYSTDAFWFEFILWILEVLFWKPLVFLVGLLLLPFRRRPEKQLQHKGLPPTEGQLISGVACPVCGTENEAGKVTCFSCGSSLPSS